jgi:hypothetical protein
MNRKLEIQNEIDAISAEIGHLEIMQFTKKILLNRLYGSFANKYSPFCDVDIASSITLTGQAVVKQAAEIGNKYASLIGVNNDINIYSDTDSVDGSTLIRTNIGILPIKILFDKFSKKSKIKTESYGHEMIDVLNLECLTLKDNKIKMGKIKRLIRHKTNKKMYKIRVNGKEIITTEDHGIMVQRDGNLIRISPKEIKKGDLMVNVI